MSKRRKQRTPPTPARFKVGDRVWVKHGVVDAQYPDIPLGGWGGTIAQVHHRGRYSVRWSCETLAAIHPVYKKRCERDGMIIEEYRLGENDLEADSGDPRTVEQPQEIVPRTLSMNSQDDRVRMVFGLTSDDLLPNPDEGSLETYYAYLDKRMSFPFEARQYDKDDWFSVSAARWVKVVALGKEPDDLDEDDGIFCEVQTAEGDDLVPLANLELRRSSPNRQLVDDYVAWFLGELVYEDDYRDEGDSFDDDDEPGEDDDSSQPMEEASWRSVALMLLEITAFTASYGAVVGSAVATMPWAKWGACVGGGAWGIIVALAQASSAHKTMPHLVVGFRKWLAGAIGLFNGAVQGAFYGIAAVAFAGAVIGGIAGLVFRRLLGGKHVGFFQFFPGSIVFTAACGVAVQAFYLDSTKATDGLWYGTMIGLGCGLFLCLVALPLAFLTVGRLAGKTCREPAIGD